MHDHLVDYMFAAESIAITLSNSVLLLAMHPEIQEKLHHELSTVCGDDYEVMDKEMMLQCELLDNIFKETSRMIPVVSQLNLLINFHYL